MVRTSKPKPKPASEKDDIPEEVLAFFGLHDSKLSKEQLLARSSDFMTRCAAKKLKKGESIRTGNWFTKLPKDKRHELLDMIFKYDDWTEKTDPSGTHSNGVVMFEGNYVMWAIDKIDVTPPGILYATPPIELCLLVKHSSEI